MYLEERFKCHQARLARSLRKVNKRRLLMGYNPRTEHAQEPPVLEQMIMEKENKIIKLRDVELFFPKTGAEGTLETHVNGFLFTSYESSFRVHILFKDIKASFFQLAYGISPPRLHFHVNGENLKKDIVFHLQNKRDRELKKFIFDVEDKWSCTEAFADLGPIQELMEENTSFGYLLPSEVEVLFTLTFFAIHVHVLEPSASPFVVVDQEDIEIVNLVVLGNGLINMTVIPKDLRVESMFEIRFPSKSLAAVKDWLYRGHVKYYVNKVENWKDRVEDIAENFQTFLEGGGWAQYELEDDATVQDYYSMTSESESEASDEKWGED